MPCRQPRGDLGAVHVHAGRVRARLGPDRHEPPADGVGQQRCFHEVMQVRNVGYRWHDGGQVGIGPAAQAGAVTGTP